MRILLTTRKAFEEPRNPISLLDMAAYLRRLGHEVDVYYLHQIINTRSPRSYDVVGLSVLQSKNPRQPVLDARRLKKNYSARVVVGGKWVQDIPDELVRAFEAEGIELCPGAGETYFQDDPIDYAHYPPWDRKDFLTLQEVHGEIMTMRGCPFRCHFCHNTERTINYFGVDRTVANIKLLGQLGQKQFFIVDDIFAANAAHMEQLYNRLRAEAVTVEGAFAFFAHIQCLNSKTMEWIKKYQPNEVQIGIESGDDGMLKQMGKTFTRAQAHEKLKILCDMGVRITGLFLIGFPGETVGSLENTLQFIRDNRPYLNWVWVSYYQPVYGTVGYQRAIQRVPRSKLGYRNTRISYVDPNLTRKQLCLYRYLMTDGYSLTSGWVKRIQGILLAVLPYSVAEVIQAAALKVQAAKRAVSSIRRRLVL